MDPRGLRNPPTVLAHDFFARGNQAQNQAPPLKTKKSTSTRNDLDGGEHDFTIVCLLVTSKTNPETHVSHFWLKGKNHSKNTYPLVITRLEKTSIYWCFSQLEHSIDRGFAATVTMISGDIPVTFWHFHRNHLENFPLRNSSQFLWLVVWNMKFHFPSYMG